MSDYLFVRARALFFLLEASLKTFDLSGDISRNINIRNQLFMEMKKAAAEKIVPLLGSPLLLNRQCKLDHRIIYFCF